MFSGPKSDRHIAAAAPTPPIVQVMDDSGVVAAAAVIAAVERSIHFHPSYFEGKPTDDAYKFLRQFEIFLDEVNC